MFSITFMAVPVGLRAVFIAPAVSAAFDGCTSGRHLYSVNPKP